MKIYFFFYRHSEAVSHFEALLADLIRQPDYTWKEAKKVLKKDSRYCQWVQLGAFPHTGTVLVNNHDLNLFFVLGMMPSLQISKSLNANAILMSISTGKI